MKSILVTGAAGYIGTVVCEHLLNSGFKVIGTDVLRFGSRPLLQLMRQTNFTFVKADITRPSDVATIFQLPGIDTIVHLAAIVGDPACKAEPELAKALNIHGTKNIFLRSEEARIRRFIFASTCSNYGLSAEHEISNEDSPLNPVSLYAETKVETERWLKEQHPSDTSKYILRFATAHGLSQRMRFDLTVNEFTRTMAEGKPLEIYDADTWRPYCHVKDFASIIEKMISAEHTKENLNVFNVGFDDENFRKRDLVLKISRAIETSPKVVFVGDGKDRRNYRVNFSKLAQFVSVSPLATLDTSVREIVAAVRFGVFSSEASAYVNV
jgi:nucleoside-diphosphate-sugar epimerase